MPRNPKPPSKRPKPPRVARMLDRFSMPDFPDPHDFPKLPNVPEIPDFPRPFGHPDSPKSPVSPSTRDLQAMIAKQGGVGRIPPYRPPTGYELQELMDRAMEAYRFPSPPPKPPGMKVRTIIAIVGMIIGLSIMTIGIITTLSEDEPTEDASATDSWDQEW